MFNGKKIIVVMPAYNAEKTLRRTIAEIPKDVVDEVILTDDGSRDHTIQLAQDLGITTYRHEHNRGYGGNQKTCYTRAIEKGADIVVMVHPDYQYTPKLIGALVGMVAYDVYDVALGSRTLGKTALSGGMPLYRYIANKVLTAFQNILLRQRLSEYHTGYRAFSRKVLETLPLSENSDDFVFDNQMLTQAVFFGFKIGEISCPTHYFPEASTITFRRAVTYGLGCILNSVIFVLARLGVWTPPFLNRDGKRLTLPGK